MVIGEHVRGGAAQQVARQAKAASGLRESMYQSSDLRKAEEQNQDLKAALGTLTEAVVFRARPDFRLSARARRRTATSPSVSAVREDLVARAGRAGLAIPEDLGPAGALAHQGAGDRALPRGPRPRRPRPAPRDRDRRRSRREDPDQARPAPDGEQGARGPREDRGRAAPARLVARPGAARGARASAHPRRSRRWGGRDADREGSTGTPPTASREDAMLDLTLLAAHVHGFGEPGRRP